MPPKESQGASKATCDVENVYRQWKECPGIRHTAIKLDRIFEPSRKDEPVKFCIRDCVHNQLVIIPLLERMARDPSHPIPYIKALCREHLSCNYQEGIVFFT